MANIPPCDPDKPNGVIYFNEAKRTSIITDGEVRHMMEIRFELSFQRDVEIKTANSGFQKEAIYKYVDDKLREPVAMWLKKNHLQYRDARVIQISFEAKHIYIDLGEPSSKLEELKQMAKAMGIDMEEVMKEAIKDSKEDDEEFADDITPIDPHEETKPLWPKEDWNDKPKILGLYKPKKEENWGDKIRKKLWDNRLKTK